MVEIGLKNVVWLLLLANVLFLVWQYSVQPGTEPGVVVVDESTFGAASASQTMPIVEPATSVGAVLGEGQITDIAAAVGKTCISIGAFDEFNGAGDARQALEAAGLQAIIREGVTQAFVGYWVQVQGIPNVDTERDYLDALRGARLGEAYAFEGETGMNISVGVFGQLERAETIRQQVEDLGMAANISERFRDVSVYYVDVGLPAGGSVDGLIEDFGAERVLQGSSAACPGVPEETP